MSTDHTENSITDSTADTVVQAGEVDQVTVNNGPVFNGGDGMAVQIINGGTVRQDGARFGGITKN